MNSLKNDERGRMMARKAVMLTIALAVAGLITAFLLPIGINAIEEQEEQTFSNENASGAVEVNGKLTANVTSSSSSTSATIELNDTDTSGTTSNTINVGSNTTYSLSNGDVDVGVESATSTGATFNVTYDTDYAYSSGASSLWGILGLAIVLAVFLMMISMALGATNRL